MTRAAKVLAHDCQRRDSAPSKRPAVGTLFWVLVAAAAFGQGSLHLVLPALGPIAQSYNVPFGTAQLTFSLTMVAMGSSARRHAA